MIIEEAMLRKVGATVGLALEPLDVICDKLIKRLTYGPERAYPLKCPDGVIYDSPGSTCYPKEHAYSKMSAILSVIQRESPLLQQRIEAATGMYCHRWGARHAPLKALWLRLRYVCTGK